MDFLLAATFTDSLGRLTNEEQKAVKITAMDLQLDPTSPGFRFHRIDNSKDRNFWSLRVGSDIRMIVHKTASSLLLCYVDHHDKAYAWAERRRIETHPKTGAAQLVEVRERIKEVTVRAPATDVAAPAIPLLFAGYAADDLLDYGVPEEWLQAVQGATEDTLFDVLHHLPQEAQEALLSLATGETPQLPGVATEIGMDIPDPFRHPDAQRRFRSIANAAELERAFDFPWEKWAVFLHPAQRQLVERSYGGPARIAGSAGTGKTIVALHRAVFLARSHPGNRVLLTTFSGALAASLRHKLHQLAGNEPEIVNRIHVAALRHVALEAYSALHGAPNLAPDEKIRAMLVDAAKADGLPYSPAFLFEEWRELVDERQIERWEEYRDVARLGRKTKLGAKQRESLWTVFDRVRQGLSSSGLTTWPAVLGKANLVDRGYDFAVIDEAQDISHAELRYLAAMAGDRPDALFFAGDLGQRIFRQPFSWRSLGVDILGRSFTLRINYRTSHQIRVQADRLLPSSLSDIDENTESRKGTVSVFDGPAPDVRTFESVSAEAAGVGSWLVGIIADGVQPHEIGLIVRSPDQIERAGTAARKANLSCTELNETLAVPAGHIAVSPMHLAKGLEFRAVAVMACDDEIMPLRERLEAVTDESDLEEVYTTERHLLYVACTRARERLLVSGVAPVSEFMVDMAHQRS